MSEALGIRPLRGLSQPLDARRIMPIPQVELDANPKIQQNNGY
ncbi:hypothetical protein [Nibrella viscosa]